MRASRSSIRRSRVHLQPSAARMLELHIRLSSAQAMRQGLRSSGQSLMERPRHSGFLGASWSSLSAFEPNDDPKPSTLDQKREEVREAEMLAPLCSALQMRRSTNPQEAPTVERVNKPFHGHEFK